LGSPIKPTNGIEEKMKKVLLISFLILFFTTTSARISTKKQDILKLIGTSIAPNGNFTCGLNLMEKILSGLEKVRE